MAKESAITWTHGTFNPWWGCVKVSPACENCYAERDSARFAPGLWGKDAPRRLFGDKHWNEPLRWNAQAVKSGKPFRVFCASMADVFEDRRDLDAARVRLWDLIERTPALTWLVLTKRPELMTKFAPARWAGGWPKNVWAMTTVESQPWAEKRIPHLLKVPAVVHGLSVEPMTGPVTLRPEWIDAEVQAFGPKGVKMFPRIDWVIAGGESGPGARPIHPQWLRALRDQSVGADIPFHVKQWGEWAPREKDDGAPFNTLAAHNADRLIDLAGNVHCTWDASGPLAVRMSRIGKKAAGRELDGKVWDQHPMGQE